MNNDLVTVYKGDIFKYKRKESPKAIVIDLDETIGCFGDLYILWLGVNKLCNLKNFNRQSIFNDILNLYPEFFRPGITHILSFIFKKKKKKHLKNLFLYTNNQCTHNNWLSLIIHFIEFKINATNLFDKIIHAFKIKNNIIEICRTSNNKNYNDLINCTIIPKKTEICFIDNTYYEEMIHDKVYYIKPLSYYHNLSKNSIINRILQNKIGSFIIENSNMSNKNQLFNFFHNWFLTHMHYSYNRPIYLDIDYNLNISKKILYHIKEFFIVSKNNNKSKKKIKSIKNFTRKNKNLL